MSKQPSDMAERQRALQPEASFLVQAPAGSGKTELVTDRILSLLAIVEQPEQVLAITFTRKAAGEMRNRVLEKLMAGRQSEPTEEHKLSSWKLAQNVLARNDEKEWHLLEYPSRLRIMTFDSLSSGLVRTMPWSSQTGGSLEISESLHRQYRQAAFQTIRQIDQSDELQAVLSHLNVDLEHLESSLVEMLQIRDQWQEALSNPQDTIVAMVQSLELLVTRVLQKIKDKLPLGFESEYVPLLAAWAQEWPDFACLKDIDIEPLSVDPDDLPRWQAVADSLMTQSNTIRKTLNKTQGVPPGAPFKAGLLRFLKDSDFSPELIEALVTVKALPTELLTKEQVQIYQQLATVLSMALEQLHQVYIADGAVDFTEVALSALNGLGSADEPADLLLALDARIQHLLVDEFQDTSQTQIDLLALLTSGWQPNDGRTVFLVGDPMQSIYRFRKAEVGLFIKVANEHRLNHVPLEVLNLRENFRSVEGVVDWNNRIYQASFPSEYDAEFGAVPYEHSVSFNGPGTLEPVRHYPFYYSNKEIVGIDAKAEAIEAAEQQVIEVVREALERHQGADKPIAILVKSRNALGRLNQRLLQANIPVRAVDMFPLSEQPYVIDLLQIIRALTYRYDRVAWLSLFRSPLCGLTLSSLHELFGDKTERNVVRQIRHALSDETLPMRLGAEQFTRFKHLSEIMLNANAEQQGLSFTMRVNMIWQQLGGHLLYSKISEKADIEAVFALLDQLAPYGSPNLEVLEEHVSELFAESVVAGSAVEIMTIHKAKGLQFEEVILYGLHGYSKNRDNMLLRLEPYEYEFEGQKMPGILLGTAQSKQHGAAEDAVTKLLKSREDHRQLLEEARLLYVATTRPCQRLHLFYLMALDNKDGVLSVRKPSKNQFFARIEQALELNIEVIKESLPEYMAAQATDNTDDAAAQTLEAAISLAASEGSEQTESPSTKTTPVGDLLRFKASTIAQLETQYAPHRQLSEQLSKEAAIQSGVWQFISDDEAILGTVAHSWLQMMGLDQLEGWDDERLYQGESLMRYQLMSAGYNEERVDAAVLRLKNLLLKTLHHDDLRAILLNPQVQHEWPLYDLDGKLLIMDLVIPHEDYWEVIDYKSSSRREGEGLEEFKLRVKTQYLPQLRSYCAYLQAIDGKAAKASLFLIEEGVFVEVIP
ncbi:MAG: UvrD-helicase domain-containing protein [Alcaligenaceae bacterium]|nr:UvrD-helicase domain-containing protein [Alcaligenaceae bacterium]